MNNLPLIPFNFSPLRALFFTPPPKKKVQYFSPLFSNIFKWNVILKRFSLLKHYLTPKYPIILTPNLVVINVPFLKNSMPQGVYYIQYSSTQRKPSLYQGCKTKVRVVVVLLEFTIYFSHTNFFYKGMKY